MQMCIHARVCAVTCTHLIGICLHYNTFNNNNNNNNNNSNNNNLYFLLKRRGRCIQQSTAHAKLP